MLQSCLESKERGSLAHVELQLALGYRPLLSVPGGHALENVDRLNQNLALLFQTHPKHRVDAKTTNRSIGRSVNMDGC